MATHLGPYPHYPVLSSRSPLAFHLEEHKDGTALSWELRRRCARTSVVGHHASVTLVSRCRHMRPRWPSSSNTVARPECTIHGDCRPLGIPNQRIILLQGRTDTQLPRNCLAMLGGTLQAQDQIVDSLVIIAKVAKVHKVGCRRQRYCISEARPPSLAFPLHKLPTHTWCWNFC